MILRCNLQLDCTVCSAFHLLAPAAAWWLPNWDLLAVQETQQTGCINSNWNFMQPIGCLPPFICCVCQSLVDYGIETAVLLDENLREGAVLAKQNGLQTDQFEQGQEHGDKGTR